MEKVGFIGSYDKTDLMLYLGKILTAVGKKVLIVDNTRMQKAKYIVPVINPTRSYVTEFEKMDVSVGFSNFEDIKQYLGVSEDKELEYDFCFVDVDSIENFENFGMNEAKKKYFVTAFDLYSLKKGLEILNNFLQPIELIKILYSKEMSKEEDDYLNYISLGTKAVWNEEYRFYIPMDSGDQSVIAENQRLSKLALRKLSSGYRNSLYYIAEDILGEKMGRDLKKAFKILEKEV